MIFLFVSTPLLNRINYVKTRSPSPTPNNTGNDSGSVQGLFGGCALDFLWGKKVKGAGVLLPPQAESRDYGTIPVNAAEPTHTAHAGGVCVHVAGLAKTEVDSGQTFIDRSSNISINMLWKIASQYGDVIAARLLAKHEECALVQFKTPHDARNAIEHLNRCSVFGRTLITKVGKHANALHWSGEKTVVQHRMCSRQTHQPAPPAPARERNSAPSAKIAIWNIPGTKPVALIQAVLAKKAPHSDPIVQESTGISGEVTVVLSGVDEAVSFLGTLNGEIVKPTEIPAMVGCGVSRPFVLCMYFVKHKPQWTEAALQSTATERRESAGNASNANPFEGLRPFETPYFATRILSSPIEGRFPSDGAVTAISDMTSGASLTTGLENESRRPSTLSQISDVYGAGVVNEAYGIPSTHNPYSG